MSVRIDRVAREALVSLVGEQDKDDLVIGDATGESVAQSIAFQLTLLGWSRGRLAARRAGLPQRSPFVGGFMFRTVRLRDSLCDSQITNVALDFNLSRRQAIRDRPYRE